MVATSGSVADASQRLHLTPQSISGQLGEREASLGVELFHRAGRGLELTEAGPGLINAPVPVGSRAEIPLIHHFAMRDGKICREQVFELWRAL